MGLEKFSHEASPELGRWTRVMGMGTCNGFSSSRAALERSPHPSPSPGLQWVTGGVKTPALAGPAPGPPCCQSQHRAARAHGTVPAQPPWAKGCALGKLLPPSLFNLAPEQTPGWLTTSARFPAPSL